MKIAYIIDKVICEDWSNNKRW